MNDDKYTTRLDKIDRNLNEIKILISKLLQILDKDSDKE